MAACVCSARRRSDPGSGDARTPPPAATSPVIEPATVEGSREDYEAGGSLDPRVDSQGRRLPGEPRVAREREGTGRSPGDVARVAGGDPAERGAFLDRGELAVHLELARALSARAGARRSALRVECANQGDRRARGGHGTPRRQREGTRRASDDRRPRAQRSRSRGPHGHRSLGCGADRQCGDLWHAEQRITAELRSRWMRSMPSQRASHPRA